MSAGVAIIGAAAHVVPRFAAPLEFAVHDTVVAALADAGLPGLEPVDTVLTSASDTLDGIMVATRSEMAGSAGKAYLHVPSSAGHALASAAALIGSGLAGTLLLVGWGEGSKLAIADSRVIQADPFYARPVGATPAALAALQAQFLLGAGLLAADAAAAYAARMAERAGTIGHDGAGPAWLRPGWCDGVVALVLAPTEAHPGAVRLCDYATSFRPYTPQSDAPDELDPAAWVTQALPPLRRPPDMIEASAPTPVCEARAGMALAGMALGGGPDWEARFNCSGGGAAAYFGNATGLHRLAALKSSLGAGQTGCMLDLAGPIGNAVTVATFERRVS